MFLSSKTKQKRTDDQKVLMARSTGITPPRLRKRRVLAKSGGLSEDEINEMVADAEANAEADKERKELVEAKNQAESLIHSTEKSVEDHGDKVDPTTIEAIELAIAALKDELENEDAGKIKAGIQNVMEASMKLGEAIYKDQQDDGAGDDGPVMDADGGPQGVDDDIVDADFEDLSDDKRSS